MKPWLRYMPSVSAPSGHGRHDVGEIVIVERDERVVRSGAIFARSYAITSSAQPRPPSVKVATPADRSRRSSALRMTRVSSPPESDSPSGGCRERCVPSTRRTPFARARGTPAHSDSAGIEQLFDRAVRLDVDVARRPDGSEASIADGTMSTPAASVRSPIGKPNLRKSATARGLIAGRGCARKRGAKLRGEDDADGRREPVERVRAQPIGDEEQVAALPRRGWRHRTRPSAIGANARPSRR